MHLTIQRPLRHGGSTIYCQSANQDETKVLRQFVAWVRADVLPRHQAWQQRNKKNGK